MLPIYTFENTTYCRISDMDPELVPWFLEWMVGQTCPYIPGLEPQDAVYPWDVERWDHYRRTGRQVWD